MLTAREYIADVAGMACVMALPAIVNFLAYGLSN